MRYPKKYVLSSGVGTSAHKLVAFDSALIAAGISDYNLLKVSSILPSNCARVEKVGKRKGAELLTAYSTISSNQKGQLISTAVAVGIPKNKKDIGVIMEFSGFCSSQEAAKNATAMVEEAMKNHAIPYKEILVTATEAVVGDEGYTSLISALSMW